MSGRMIDFRRGAEVEARAALERLLAWTEPARSQLGIEVDLPERNGAQRAREALDAGRLDRGHLPRRRGRDQAHLHGRRAGAQSRPRAALGARIAARVYRLPRR